MKRAIIILMILMLILLPILGFTAYKSFNYSARQVILDETEDIEVIKEEPEEIVELIVEPEISNIKLLAVGDIMFHTPQHRAAYDKETGIYDFMPTFKYIEKYVKDSDIAIGNFETVTGGVELGFHGFPRFNTPKESLLALKEAGFHILSTANNHSLDQGKKGIINTIDYIEEYGMKNIGTYKETGNNILIEEVKDIKIGFLAYTYGVNGLDSLLTKEELNYMVNIIDEDRIKTDIESLKILDVDLIVVFIHWGHEYHRQPSEYQIELGEKMVEWGANIILASHPHVIQKSQIINTDGQDNFIIYSLGNFLSNQRNETMGNSYAEDGLMLRLEIEKDLSSQDTIIKSIEYIPTWVHKYWESNKAFYEILPIDDILANNLNRELTDRVKSRIEKSFVDTMDKVTED